MQIVEKLTGRDLVALEEAGIIKRHEARRAIDMPPFNDGFQCPQCNFVIVKPSPEEQLDLLTTPPTPETTSKGRTITATADGVVVTESDAASLPWDPKEEETPAPIEPEPATAEATSG